MDSVLELLKACLGRLNEDPVAPPVNPREPRERPVPERRKFNQTHVLEATVAAVLATAILGTSTGVGWLVTALPSKLQQLQEQIIQIRNSQNAFQSSFNERFTVIEEQVRSHEERLIKLEVRQ